MKYNLYFRWGDQTSRWTRCHWNLLLSFNKVGFFYLTFVLVDNLFGQQLLISDKLLKSRDNPALAPIFSSLASVSVADAKQMDFSPSVALSRLGMMSKMIKCRRYQDDDDDGDGEDPFLVFLYFYLHCHSEWHLLPKTLHPVTHPQFAARGHLRLL